MTASTCSLRSGHQSCIRAEFPSLQVFGSYVHLSLTRSSSSFVCCAFKPALWTAACSSSTQPLMSSWSLGKKKKRQTPYKEQQPWQSMYKLLTRITPHGARVLFQGDMSEVAAGGGVCAQVHAANEGRRECPQQPRGGPRRHRHSTPSDGDEVAAAVEQHRKSSVWTADPEVFFTWGGDRWPTAPASFGGNYCSYTLQARAPSDSHNRCDWTTFLSDHLSPAHQHGKCAH